MGCAAEDHKECAAAAHLRECGKGGVDAGVGGAEYRGGDNRGIADLSAAGAGGLVCCYQF